MGISVSKGKRACAMVFAVMALGFIPGSLSAQSAGGGSSGAVAKTKNPFQVNNTGNYWQMQQTTSMGPSIGWSRIITDFPQNGQQSGFGGGLNSGFGQGGQSGQSSGSGGGQSPNNGGSDPASGVFLSASYNTLVGLPFKQQSSSNGLGGLQPGFGGGGFGYGGNPYGGKGLGGGGFNQLNAKGFGNIGGNGGTGL